MFMTGKRIGESKEAEAMAMFNDSGMHVVFKTPMPNKTQV